MDKNIIRKEKLELRWKMTSGDKYAFDHLVYKKVRDYCFMKSRKNYISIYWPVENEVDTIAIIDELLKNGFLVCVPFVVDNQEMVMKPITELNFDYEYYKNIRQPTTEYIVLPEEISSYIIPIVAYDEQNNRLGYGMGYYDRYLASVKNSYKIGLAYSFQLTKKITNNKNDVKLDRIITEV